MSACQQCLQVIQIILITSSSEGDQSYKYIVLVVIPKKVERYPGCFEKRWYVAFVLLVFSDRFNVEYY